MKGYYREGEEQSSNLYVDSEAEAELERKRLADIQKQLKAKPLKEDRIASGGSGLKKKQDSEFYGEDVGEKVVTWSVISSGRPVEDDSMSNTLKQQYQPLRGKAKH